MRLGMTVVLKAELVTERMYLIAEEQDIDIDKTLYLVLCCVMAALSLIRSVLAPVLFQHIGSVHLLIVA